MPRHLLLMVLGLPALVVVLDTMLGIHLASGKRK